MKVELKEGEDCNSLAIHELYIDEERYERIQDLSDCPEDAHIGRDLVDGNDIIRYIQMGYNACRNGEKLDIVYSDLED